MTTAGPDETVRQFEVAGGVDLMVYPTSKFRTTLINILFHRPLDDGTSGSAVVPYVLRRGTRRFPDLAAISRHLEMLFGAGLDVDVMRFGERQILSFRIDLVDDRYLLMGDRDLFRRGLRLLRDIIVDPVLIDGVFPADVVSQELLNLRRFVERMEDDKARYALERCIGHMCRGEPYARFEYGDVESINRLTPEEVTACWRDALATSTAEIYVVGNKKPDAVYRVVEDYFGDLREAAAPSLPPDSKGSGVSELRRVREEADVAQARLVIGFRTPVVYGHRLSIPMSVMNSIYGGGPVSRLFRKVREERSLAYYCSSTVDQAKGVAFVSAGIDAAHADEVEQLVRQELAQLTAGRMELDELRTAKEQLRAGLRSMTDSPARIAGFMQENRASGGRLSFRDLMARIGRVRRKDVAAAAGSLELDTVYLLAGSNGT